MTTSPELPADTRVPIIALDRNEASAELPRDVRGEILERLAALDWRCYPRAPYPDALAARIAEASGVTPSHVVVGSGGIALIGAITDALVQPGDRVATFAPTYHRYLCAAATRGAAVCEFRLGRDFVLDLDRFAAWLAGVRPALTWIANPNNPTGVAAPVAALAAACARVPGIVVVDEAYAEFTGETIVPWLAGLLNVVVLRSFSKAFALAGFRVAYALAAPPLAERLRARIPAYSVGIPNETAASVVLEHRARLSGRAREIAAHARRFAHLLRSRLGLRAVDPSANFVLVELGERAAGLVAALRGAGVRVRAFPDDPVLARHVRISVGSAREMRLTFLLLASIMESR